MEAVKKWFAAFWRKLRLFLNPVALHAWTTFGFGLAFRAVEFLVVLGTFAYVARGTYAFGERTKWTLEGFLTALDAHWKGALILAALLFVRPLQELLSRITKFTPPWGEIAFPPAGDTQTLDPGRKPPEPPKTP